MDVNAKEIYRVVFENYPDVLDVKQVGELLRVSSKTVYKLIHESALPCLKIGREFRILKIALIRYMEVLSD